MGLVQPAQNGLVHPALLYFRPGVAENPGTSRNSASRRCGKRAASATKLCVASSAHPAMMRNRDPASVQCAEVAFRRLHYRVLKRIYAAATCASPARTHEDRSRNRARLPGLAATRSARKASLMTAPFLFFGNLHEIAVIRFGEPFCDSITALTRYRNNPRHHLRIA